MEFGVISVGYVDHIVPDIFLDHKPWAPAHSESFPLSDGVEPISFMFAYLFAGGYVDERPRLLSEVTGYEIGIIDFPEKAYSL